MLIADKYLNETLKLYTHATRLNAYAKMSSVADRIYCLWLEFRRPKYIDDV